MGKILRIISLLILAGFRSFGQSAYNCEWWIDDNRAELRSGHLESGQLRLSEDVSGLESGFHYFNFRVCDANNVWGSVYRSMFFKPASASISASAYEYWIDNDYAARKSGSLSGNSNSYTVSLTDTKEGLHRFSYRVKNSDGVWGSVYVKHFFHKKQAPGFASYEYWIDNDYNNRVTGSSAAQNLMFDVALDNELKEGLHYFNFRACNDDGVFGATYRKLFYLQDKAKSGRIIGYRHSVNGTDLGYVKLDPQPSEVYTFDVELPAGVGIDIADMPIQFDGDVLSVSHSDPVSYRIQIETDRGWGMPSGFEFEAGVNFSTEAENMPVPSSLTFTRPNGAQFKAVKFESDGRPLYAHTDRTATMDIYSGGTKVLSIPPGELTATKVLTLDAGIYYGVVYNVASNAESDMVTLTIDDSILENVDIAYNGRFVTMSSPEEGASIYYTLDGSAPDSGSLYSGPFDAGGLCYVRAVAKIGADLNSGYAGYQIAVYADEDHLETAKGGMLTEAFGWNEDFPKAVEKYSISGPLDEADFEVVRGMESLRHLNIGEVEVQTVPDGAFAGMSHLTSITMPENLSGYGEGVFSGCDMLSAIVFNSQAISIGENLKNGVSNPNLLIYVSDSENVSVSQEYQCNVVKGQFAEKLRLEDAMPFHAPKDFIARDASYVRRFSRQTGFDSCSGWETMAVPFDVQTIMDEKSEILPFASAEDGDRRFWLYSPSTSGWEGSASIAAYQPYLVAMPNHYWYDADLIISGEVTFHSDNVLINATPGQCSQPYKNGMMMSAGFVPLPASEDCYVLNDEDYPGYAPGGVFVRNLRDVRPFEGFLTVKGGPAMIPVMDASEVELLASGMGVKVWTEGSDICIYSGMDCRIPVYDTVGTLVRTARVSGGETCRIPGLCKGVYIVAATKVYVK